MKRVIIFIILAATGAAGNAQFFIEGSAGISYNNTPIYYDLDNVYPSLFSFNVSPQAGRWLNDNIAVGVKVSLLQNIGKDSIPDTDNPNLNIARKTISPEWRLAVFGRYKLWKMKKLSLLVETPAGIGRSITKEKNGTAAAIKTRSESEIFINAFPVFLYDLTDRISLTATCNFANLGMSFRRVTLEGSTHKSKFNNFNFGAQSTIVSSLGEIYIGFIYNFNKAEI